jgi:hypothetical protein
MSLDESVCSLPTRHPPHGCRLPQGGIFQGAAHVAWGVTLKDENIATSPFTPEPSPPIGGEGDPNCLILQEPRFSEEFPMSRCGATTDDNG